MPLAIGRPSQSSGSGSAAPNGRTSPVSRSRTADGDRISIGEGHQAAVRRELVWAEEVARTSWSRDRVEGGAIGVNAVDRVPERNVIEALEDQLVAGRRPPFDRALGFDGHGDRHGLDARLGRDDRQDPVLGRGSLRSGRSRRTSATRTSSTARAGRSSALTGAIGLGNHERGAVGLDRLEPDERDRLAVAGECRADIGLRAGNDEALLPGHDVTRVDVAVSWVGDQTVGGRSKRSRKRVLAEGRRR